MEKTPSEGWPVIDKDFEVNNANVIPDGFDPEPDPSKYIVPTAPEQRNIVTNQDTLSRLESPADRVDDPNRVGDVYAKEGKQSIKPIATSGYVAEEKIPDSFFTPAPVRDTPAEKKFFDKFKGWLAGK